MHRLWRRRRISPLIVVLLPKVFWVAQLLLLRRLISYALEGMRPTWAHWQGFRAGVAESYSLKLLIVLTQPHSLSFSFQFLYLPPVTKHSCEVSPPALHLSKHNNNDCVCHVLTEVTQWPYRQRFLRGQHCGAMNQIFPAGRHFAISV